MPITSVLSRLQRVDDGSCYRNINELEEIVERKHDVVTAGMVQLINERQDFLAKASK